MFQNYKIYSFIVILNQSSIYGIVFFTVDMYFNLWKQVSAKKC